MPVDKIVNKYSEFIYYDEEEPSSIYNAIPDEAREYNTELDEPEEDDKSK